MGGEVIAEKFALLKSRGSNGVSRTYIVEDTMLGQRAVVKVSDRFDHPGLEYLKTINLARESGIPGILLPLEGGLLEEEAGYYLAFPELGEPSLDNYLRMGAPITCGEITGIAEEILHILESLHGCGLYHLFINTRNVFYRPRRGVTLKDPALKREYFNLFLEMVAIPDFRYFSPGVMDGVMPGADADIYALGVLVERLLEEAVDVGASVEEPSARWLVERCRCPEPCAEARTASGLLFAWMRMREEHGEKEPLTNICVPDRGMGRDGTAGPSAMPGTPSGARRDGKPAGLERGASRLLLSLVVAAFLAFGAAFGCIFAKEGQRGPALEVAGSSKAGGEAARGAVILAVDRPAGEEPVPESRGMAIGDSRLEAAADSGSSPRENPPGSSGTPAVTDDRADAGLADPGPKPPVASFSLSPAEGQSPLRVLLDASSSYDPDGSIVAYEWSCGGSGRSVQHVFESNVIPAVIPVTLTVTDNGGHTSHATRYVTLY